MRFTAKTMQSYSGKDSSGTRVELNKNDLIDISEAVAKLLLQKYGDNFEIVLNEKPKHAPKADKLLRKVASTKTK